MRYNSVVIFDSWVHAVLIFKMELLGLPYGNYYTFNNGLDSFYNR